MTIVAKVWIEEDCITCDACQDICPEVFWFPMIHRRLLLQSARMVFSTGTSVELQWPVLSVVITER